MVKSKNILIVVRWPLGGIRTYMRYVFSHFPQEYHLTLLATSNHEDEALKQDVEQYSADLHQIKITGKLDFVRAVYKELSTKNYDLIISQGFVSAVAAYPANLFFRLPHILTIHGVVEPHYLSGRLGFVKRRLLRKVLSSVTVLYGVSSDILQHLYEEFPALKVNGPKPLVILNGIKPSEFDVLPAEPLNLRETLRLDPSVFLFGFFGRFMPQKGFDLIIEAVAKLKDESPGQAFAVVAVGSGDYLREYQSTIREKGLDSFFYFLPFQPMIYHLYPQVNVVLMPSRWEASGLLAMEALCVGAPIIASDCIGLRETISDTPALVINSGIPTSLVEAMYGCLKNNDFKNFTNFIPIARKKYDVKQFSDKYIEFIDNLLD